MAGASPSSPRRLSYIDWMRGLAILIMIEAHVIDSWTRLTERGRLAFGCAAVLAGFAAPTFLFLAGVGVALGASSRAKRTGDPGAAAASVRRRGWEIFGLAFLFRIQAYMLHPKAMLAGVLKVDILNIMGPSIVAAAAVWQAGHNLRRRLLLLGGCALAVTLLTPIVRTAPGLAWLPDPIEWYLRPVPGRNNFTFFPWAGFVFAGALVGVLIAQPRDAAAERRFHAILAPSALLFAAACYAGSYLPSIYAESNFWTSSPMFFLLRVGIVTAALSGAYFWEQRRRMLPLTRPWSPMALFGQSSLFVYWVHVELVYGIATRPLQKNLSFETSLLYLAFFSLFMFALTLLKNWGVARWKTWRSERKARREVPEFVS
jgi:uncharacterized membrane protein